ncbi:MAG: LptF/LptG family permease [Candidatus Kapabacteria bacterium]|nr:LptF/LptG family permease [Candidatus Kapabacteria bacterium]
MVKIIDRVIVKEHIGPFLFGFIIVMFLNLMQFLLNNLDKLVGKGLSVWVIIQLILFNLAWMAVLAVPMGILLSTLMAFGGMSASNEIVVLKSSGASLIRMMAPVIILGMVFSYGLYWFNDQILPETNHSAKTLMIDIQRKKPTLNIESGQFSSELEGYTILSRYVDSVSGKLYGVTIYDNRKTAEAFVTSADSGIVAFTGDYSRLILTLFDGENQYLVVGSGMNERKTLFKKYQLVMHADGFSFTRSDEASVSRSDREMKIADMQKIVDEAESRYQSALKKINSELDKQWLYLNTGFENPGIKPATVNKPKIDTISTQKHTKNISKPPESPKSFTVETEPERKKLPSNLKSKKIPVKQLSFEEQINRLRDSISQLSKNGNITKNEKGVSIGHKTVIPKDSVRNIPKDSTKSSTITQIEQKADSNIYSKLSKEEINSKIDALEAVQRRIQSFRSAIGSETFQLKEGHERADKFIVEIQKKYAIPFACFIFVFVGAPLGIITRGGNFGWSAGISIGFYILYWACLIGGEKLSDRNYMSPYLSMWFGNIIVGLIGIILTLKVNNESLGLPFKAFFKRILNK